MPRMRAPDENAKRLTLFENAILEKLTVVSVPWFIATWGVLLPLVALVGWGSTTPLAGMGLVCLGLLAWTLFEYVAHRFLFHWEAGWQTAKQVVFVIHGNHHLQPKDRLRNLMPPIVSIPVAACIWALFYIAGGPAATWAFLGFATGYVAYDLTHYACHQWRMPGRLGQMLKRHHMRHHFIDDRTNFAITAIFWDRVFGSRAKGSWRDNIGRLEPAE